MGTARRGAPVVPVVRTSATRDTDRVAGIPSRAHFCGS